MQSCGRGHLLKILFYYGRIIVERGMNGKLRAVKRTFRAEHTSDGGGVRLKRSIGMPDFSHVDPFLLLDEFYSESAEDYIAGFPSHPHRGFETVTYMISGSMKHEDSAGHSGVLKSGSVQWMTAGRGIVHSEMPLQDEGLMHGFQLWVNLPRSEKMRPPRYQNIEPEDIPEILLDGGGKIRVIAGSVGDVTGPVRGVVTEPIYLDVMLPAGLIYEHQTASDHSVIAYPFEGSCDPGYGEVDRGTLIVFGGGEVVRIHAGAQGVRYLYLAARPLREPIFRGGPFVMNTREEVQRAFEDYSSGRFV
jgi:hypothetical protein